jgi:hypothetical protein
VFLHADRIDQVFLLQQLQELLLLSPAIRSEPHLQLQR